MDFFRTPGANLDGTDRARFEEIQELVNNSTNEFLVRPDWNSNISCSDKISLIDNPKILAEIIFLFRRKFTNKNPQIIVLALHLLSTLVNNCGHKFHLILLNDEKFLKDLSNLSRTYNQKLGSDNKQVCDVALDLVQSWGEAFLTKRNQFNAIVELYFTLRKEGLPFKSRQFDPSRVPIVLPEKGKPNQAMYHDDFTYEEDQDAELAAAIQCSLAVNNSTIASSSNSNPMNHSSTMATNKPTITSSLSKVSTNNTIKSKEEQELEETVNSLTTPMAILIELILASNHQREIQNNEIAQDVITQLQLFQAKMNTLIDHTLLLDPKELEKLFALNEDAYNLTAIYRKIRDGHMSLGDGKLQVKSIQKEQEKKNNLEIDRKDKSNKTSQNTINNNLLDLNNNEDNSEKFKKENDFITIKTSATSTSSSSSVIFDPFAPESSTALDSLVTVAEQQKSHVPIAIKLINPLVPTPIMKTAPTSTTTAAMSQQHIVGTFPSPMNNTTYVHPYQPQQYQPQQQLYQASSVPFQQSQQDTVLQAQSSISYSSNTTSNKSPYNTMQPPVQTLAYNNTIQPVPYPVVSTMQQPILPNNYTLQATTTSSSYSNNNFINPPSSNVIAVNSSTNPLDLFNTAPLASVVPPAVTNITSPASISNTSNANIGIVNTSTSKANPFDLLDS